MPLAGAEQTMQQYTEWEASQEGELQVPASLHKGHKQALQMLAVRASSEASVAAGKPADATLLAAYMAYIKLEEACPVQNAPPCSPAHDLMQLAHCTSPCPNQQAALAVRR